MINTTPRPSEEVLMDALEQVEGADNGVYDKNKSCCHSSQRLLVVVGKEMLYQCEQCKDVIVARVQ